MKRVVLAVVAALLVFAAPAGAKTKKTWPPKPTIVLVHGAFADASGWNDVTERLQDRGYNVLAPANPLRGVTADAASLRRLLEHISGPVVLVGHSYGGVVITNAATGNPNVKALVYAAAFAPAQGETVQQLTPAAGGAMLGLKALDLVGDGTPPGTEGTIKQDLFREIFAADLPRRVTNVMAVSQRPASLVTLGEGSGVPAWASIPSWALVPTRDNTIGTGNLRAMAKRAKARTWEVRNASHVVMMSEPAITTELILQAARGK
ncbi:alpha/beta hydrolase [Solirubrobacter sp. CPCC 204708]|uniref:Alpha/beta hydrolase n=1 Tax=Solirubrobacter deserti TaxID=2282478 RepID=A0ABT4RRE1_9ACTN|nr:alpha/beta hydrolase [Solirubrobacter deserti]MBE2320546.1 alpha/beta hydrolase [Solirubrobacter deserti]MDA0140826.1 alpha/beta hydrolase [Solirubrobacter deserti]